MLTPAFLFFLLSWLHRSDATRLLLYTYASHRTEVGARYLMEAHHLGYDVRVLGYDVPFLGYSMKPRLLRKELEDLYFYGDDEHREDTLVMFTDMWDVVLQAEADEVISIFLDRYTPGVVVFSEESSSSPIAAFSDVVQYEDSSEHSPNSGGYIGFLPDVLNYLQRICMRVPNDIEDGDVWSDQFLLQMEFLAQYPDKLEQHNLTGWTYSDMFWPFFPSLSEEEWRARSLRCFATPSPSPLPDAELVIDMENVFFNTLFPRCEDAEIREYEGRLRLFDRKTKSFPAVAHANNNLHMFFNLLHNIHPAWWDPESGYHGFRAVGLDEWDESDYPEVFISVFIDHPVSVVLSAYGTETVEEWTTIFYSQLLELDYPLERVYLYVDTVSPLLLPPKSLLPEFADVFEVVSSEPTAARLETKSEAFWMLDCMRAKRLKAIETWEETSAPYIFMVQVEHHITEPALLKLLMDRGVTFVSPMLPGGHDGYEANFYHSLRMAQPISMSSYFPEYEEYLISREWQGLWAVGVLSGPILAHAHGIHYLTKAYTPKHGHWEKGVYVDNFWSDIEGVSAFDVLGTGILVSEHQQLFVDNTEDFGEWIHIEDWRKQLSFDYLYGNIGLASVGSEAVNRQAC